MNDLFKNTLKKHKEKEPYIHKAMLIDLIQQVLSHCSVGTVIISDRLINEIKSKLWRMEKAVERAKGGKSKKELYKKWANGTLSVWKLKIYYSEVENIVTKKLNDKLIGEKRKLEDKVEEMSTKIAKLESKAEKSSNSIQHCKNKFKRMSQKLIKIQRQQTGTRGPDRHKSFSDYAKRHQKRIRAQLTTDCETGLSFLGTFDFVATEVKVFNFSTNESEVFHLTEELDMENSVNVSAENDYINLLLYTKDRFGISNQAYHELSMVCQEMPRSCKIKDRIKEINKKWNLFQTPGNTVGVQQSIESRLEARVKVLVEKNEEGSLPSKIKVKLSGDGTNVGKHLHVINITFTILEEGSRAMSAEGNHLVAVVKVPENYDSLFVALGDIRNEVEGLSKIYVGNQCFEIEWFLGGDWKFLACVCGLGAAHATRPCIWCKCSLYDHYDPTKSWSLIDESKGARTVKEIQDLLKHKCQATYYNVKHAPLFPSIPLDHVIIDPLHLFLRICDNLINLLILQLRKEDAIEKKKNFSEGLDRSKYIHVAGWEKYLNETLKIPFNWYVCKESKKLKWRDLTGPEKLKLFQDININQVLPNFKDSAKIQKLWSDFYEIAGLLSSTNQNEISVQEFSNKTKLWLDLFLSLYQMKHVTPYMHALVWHVPEFLHLYNSICPFTQQGLEKLNDKTTKDFFRSTNQRGIDALFQLVQKRNRMEYLEDMGAKRVANVQRCNNCFNPGHNIKTCTAECNTCQHKPCCSPNHLKKLEGHWKKNCLSV